MTLLPTDRLTVPHPRHRRNRVLTHAPPLLTHTTPSHPTLRSKQPSHRPSQLISILFPHKAMPLHASRTSVEAYSGISPKLMIAIVAFFVVFLVVVVGFCLPADKTSCPSASNRCQCGPRACQHPTAAHPRPPTRPGLAHPTASIPRCPACKNADRTAEKASQVSQESIRSPQTLSYYGRRAPTGVLLAQAGPRRSSSSVPSSPATSTAPHSLSLGYPARGPTATVRPAVW
ncbi:hypothetical protein V8D89_005436 [Ganoderma adspersum]